MGEDELQTAFDPIFERSTVTAHLVKAEKSLCIARSQRPAIRLARQSSEYFFGAREFFLGHRIAYENPPAARRVLGSNGIDRAFDRDRTYLRIECETLDEIVIQNAAPIVPIQVDFRNVSRSEEG